MAARENEIGRCRCPVCSSTRAALRFSAKGLAYVVCDTCNAQVFARSDRSDTALRALHIAEAKAPAVVPAPTPAPEPETTPVAPATATQIKPAAKGLGWGVMA